MMYTCCDVCRHRSSLCFAKDAILVHYRMHCKGLQYHPRL
jgi:hypothetical protein